jgi:hypothetical protein
VLPLGTALIDPGLFLASFFVVADAAGAGSYALALPSSTAFVGLHLACQTVFDPPLSLSNGVELVICP